MGTGWNSDILYIVTCAIITDWDMGTGWNPTGFLSRISLHYNRLGYGYWLEQCRCGNRACCNYNRLGYGYWLELFCCFGQLVKIL